MLVEDIEGYVLMTLSMQEPDLACKDTRDPAHLSTLTHTFLRQQNLGVCLPLEFNLESFDFLLLSSLPFPFSHPRVLGPAIVYLNVLTSFS